MTLLLTSLYLALALKTWSSDWSLESLLVISAGEFIRLTALTQAATAARYVALADYVNGAYSNVEESSAA